MTCRSGTRTRRVAAAGNRHPWSVGPRCHPASAPHGRALFGDPLTERPLIRHRRSERGHLLTNRPQLRLDVGARFARLQRFEVPGAECLGARPRPRRGLTLVVIAVEAAGMLPQVERVATDYGVPCYAAGGFDS